MPDTTTLAAWSPGSRRQRQRSPRSGSSSIGRLTTVPALGAAVARLSAELADMCLDRTSLLAAMRATLEADADGEADPLVYLRDELTDRETQRGQEEC
jgi:hypothetical protein